MYDSIKMPWWIIFVLYVTSNAVLARSAYNSRPVEDRIIQGKEADIKDYPYQISFRVGRGSDSYFCGGFIISEDYILTAAHCSEKATPETITLRAGSSYRENGTIIPIAEVFTHEEYGNPPLDKDVGIFKTAEPIEFSDVIQPIDLPTKGTKLQDESEVDVSGWGREKFNANKLPERLMQVKIKVMAHWRCKVAYYSIMTDNMWCGGDFILGGKGTCQGDSGGAAVQNGKAVGIVSFGRICGFPLSPSAFADIAAPAVRDYISKITGL